MHLLDIDSYPSGEHHHSAHLIRFSVLLKHWRISQSVKISEAAAQLGVSASTWGHWETGTRFPSCENLIHLANLTGIPPQHFFCPNADRCPFESTFSAPPQ